MIKDGDFFMSENKNSLKLWELALILAFMLSAVFTVLTTEQTALSSQLIRLHVVANSDSDHDQSLKLMVRDRILTEAADITTDAENAEEAALMLSENKMRLVNAAEEVLRGGGSSDTVTVTLARERFPTTEYESFSLPAGGYTALRVNIGRAEGHNWWCVVFPQLCTASDVGAFDEFGLDEGEVRLITEEDGYIIKFRLVEIAEKLIQRMAHSS